MTWLVTLGLLIVGLIMIIKGGDMFVDAASWMAVKTGIPRVIIGATVVSLATTMPEMIVSFLAAGNGQVDMAIGNAVGSATVNTGLIMGICLICIPSTISRQEFWPRAIIMLTGILILVIAGVFGRVDVWVGVILIALFLVSMADNIRQARGAERKIREQTGAPNVNKLAASIEDTPEIGAAGGVAVVREKAMAPTGDTVKNLLGFAIGAAVVVIGSDLLVDNATVMARLIGVSERVIGVTIVAIGTSLPEVVTTLTAIAKKQGDLSVGNIIGANIIDLALILPISSLIAGKALPISPQFAMVDLPACLIIGAVALLPPLVTGKLQRWQGILTVVLYIVYLAITVMLPA